MVFIGVLWAAGWGPSSVSRRGVGARYLGGGVCMGAALRVHTPAKKPSLPCWWFPLPERTSLRTHTKSFLLRYFHDYLFPCAACIGGQAGDFHSWYLARGCGKYKGNKPLPSCTVVKRDAARSGSQGGVRSRDRALAGASGPVHLWVGSEGSTLGASAGHRWRGRGRRQWWRQEARGAVRCGAPGG